MWSWLARSRSGNGRDQVPELGVALERRRFALVLQELAQPVQQLRQVSAYRRDPQGSAGRAELIGNGARGSTEQASDLPVRTDLVFAFRHDPFTE
jgi:hypothetical protein